MDLSTVILVIGLLGVVCGVRKPWAGGIAGLLITPFLYSKFPAGAVTLVAAVLVCGLLGLASGFVTAMLIAGLKGRGHEAGTTYVGGFGAHHPGGLILSNEEREGLENQEREIVVSY